MGYRILLIDDEQDILEFVKYNLERDGYEVFTASDGAEGLQKALAVKPHLILLDMMMPVLDGIETCKAIRNSPSLQNVMVVFLSAVGSEESQLGGYGAGADDYIPKPFSLPVLAARVAAHLAREGRQAVGGGAEVRFAGNVTIDFRQCAVFADGSPVGLTPREFAIVSLLAKHPGRVFDRDLIHQKVGGWDAASSPLVVTEHVRRIRKKLLDAGAETDPIETVWGLGYRWRG